MEGQLSFQLLVLLLELLDKLLQGQHFSLQTFVLGLQCAGFTPQKGLSGDTVSAAARLGRKQALLAAVRGRIAA